MDDTPERIVSPDTRRADRLPPGQTHVAIDRATGRGKWPVLHYGGVPHIDRATWSLRLFGHVEAVAQFDWARFDALPKAEVHCDIHCVTTWSRFDNLFSGVAVRTILEHVRPLPGATHVLIHAHGPERNHFTTNLPLERFADDDCLFATHHDDEPLTPEHGAPVRLVVPKLYFWKSAKWVTGVEFISGDRPGFWEQNGYHMKGDPWREERFGGSAG